MSSALDICRAVKSRQWNSRRFTPESPKVHERNWPDFAKVCMKIRKISCQIPGGLAALYIASYLSVHRLLGINCVEVCFVIWVGDCSCQECNRYCIDQVSNHRHCIDINVVCRHAAEIRRLKPQWWENQVLYQHGLNGWASNFLGHFAYMSVP